MNPVNRQFILAGNATFTIECPDVWVQNLETVHRHEAKPHYTFKVRGKPDRDDASRHVYFVSLLTGPDNESNFTYVGILLPDNGGEIRMTSKSRYRDDAIPVQLVRRVMQRIFTDTVHVMEEKGFRLHHEGRCCRCGRKLTVPESIESGIGPECAGKL